jgi:3-deoxy-D-manno-octulosonic-acid transferase
MLRQFIITGAGFVIILYNALYISMFLFLAPIIISMVVSSKKRRKAVLPRLGLYGHHVHLKKNTRPLWIHALSVGEVHSAVPLVRELKHHFKDRHIVFSTTTNTGFEIANRLLKDDVNAIFFFPYDFLFSVKHVVKHIDPAGVIIVESDIWPNFLFEMKHRSIPVFLVNARLSRRSFSGYRLVSFFTRTVFSSFAKICAQSQQDARHFRMLTKTNKNITTTGNLKFDQAHEPVSNKELELLRLRFNIGLNQKILLAGSTHKGEESLLMDIFARLRNSFDELVLVIAPRDPKRSEAIRKLYQSAGFSVMLLTQTAKTHSETKADVIIIDTLGVLKKIYALADVAVIGGSFTHRGGHNPLEPAAFSKPIIFGPDMSNFLEIAGLLVQSNGAFQVKDANSLFKAVVLLLGNSKYANETGENAFNVFLNNKGSVEKTVKEIVSFPW